MRIPHHCLFALLLVGASARLGAMSNADVIKMKEADFSDETILLSIAKEPAGYDTSTDALIALKKAGLSEAVIQKIMAAEHEKNRAPAAVTATMSAPAAAASASAASAPTPDVAASAPTDPVADPARASFLEMDFPSIAPPMVDPVVGKEYFLRSTLFFERGKHSGTNYTRGAAVPINTPVKIELFQDRTIGIRRIDTGESLKIDNVDKYTRKSLGELARTLFAEVKTPLEQLPPEVESAVKRGELRKGMTKELVLMTRGYPPAHETPSLDGNRWVYWSSRFVKLTIVFNDQGRLIEGRGIY